MTKNRSLARLIWPITNQDHLTQNRAHGAESAERRFSIAAWTAQSLAPIGNPTREILSSVGKPGKPSP